MSQRLKLTLTFCLCLRLAVFLAGCEPTKPQPRQVVTIPDGEIDPTLWGRAWPEEFELWKKTEEPVSARRSKYKTGMDSGPVTMDKLSHFPYMALLFNGLGFGVEYNEPRGHAYMVRDQLEIDSSRLGAGGVCLSCKSPYSPGLQKEMGVDYFRKPFKEVLSRLPDGLSPPPGVRVLDEQQHPLQGRGLLCGLPHALYHRRGPQGLRSPRDEPGPGRHEGLQAVPCREPAVAAGAGLLDPGPDGIDHDPGRLPVRHGGQALRDDPQGPAEGLRILGDSIAFGGRAEAYLRQALSQAELEFKDPYGLQEKFF